MVTQPFRVLEAAEGAATAYEKPGTEEEDPRPGRLLLNHKGSWKASRFRARGV